MLSYEAWISRAISVIVLHTYRYWQVGLPQIATLLIRSPQHEALPAAARVAAEPQESTHTL